MKISLSLSALSGALTHSLCLLYIATYIQYTYTGNVTYVDILVRWYMYVPQEAEEGGMAAGPASRVAPRLHRVRGESRGAALTLTN